VADKASADVLRQEIKDTFRIVTSFVRFPLPFRNSALMWWWERTSYLYFEPQKKVTFYHGFALIMYEILPCKYEQNLLQLICGNQLHDVYVALRVTTAREHDGRMVL